MFIVSASKRTDVPAFYSSWLMQRIRERRVVAFNPRTLSKRVVSLAPKDVAAIVFWSKNYARIVSHLDELESSGHRFYFHYTLTGLPGFFEPSLPPLEERVELFRFLANRYSPSHLQWRYDPIVLTTSMNFAFHENIFKKLLGMLKGLTKRCYVSFLSLPENGEIALQEKMGENILKPDREEQNGLLSTLADLAANEGIQVYSCDKEFAGQGLVKEACCVEKDLISELFALNLEKLPKLRSCGCYENVDIGAFGTCSHGCIYCYASPSREKAVSRYKLHSPTDLHLPVPEEPQEIQVPKPDPELEF